MWTAKANYTSCCCLSEKVPAGEWALGDVHRGYLVPSQGNCDRDVQGLVDDPRHGFDQGHEEKGKPDNADEQNDDHASHAILHHFLLLLPTGLRVSLQERSHTRLRLLAPRSRWGLGRRGRVCAPATGPDWVPLLFSLLWSGESKPVPHSTKLGSDVKL